MRGLVSSELNRSPGALEVNLPMNRPADQNRKVKVCHISTVHPAFDIRIFYKECITLADSGYAVSLIVTHVRDEEVGGVKIVPLPKAKNRFTRVFVHTLRAFFCALKTRALLYHFHDSELVYVGILLKSLGKKVIYDIHDNAPKDILYKDWIKNKILKQVTSSVIACFEFFAAFFFDSLICATKDIADRFRPSKTTLIRNFPIKRLIEKSPISTMETVKPVVVYAGGLFKIRGIKEMVNAMAIVGNKEELWLLGEWESEEYYEVCRKAEGWQFVKYIGNLKQKEVYGIMKISTMGILNYLPIEIHFNALPNKPFEYMACSLPVVMSNFSFWKDVFKDAAIYANPESPEEIAHAIQSLLDDKIRAKEIGNNGFRLVGSEYSWEAESRNLLNLYGRILKTV